MSASASSFLACSSRPALRNAPADSSRCLSWRRRIVISSSSVRGSPFSISPFFTAALSILKASTRGLSRSLIASLVSREMSSLLLTASSSYVLSSRDIRACACRKSSCTCSRLLLTLKAMTPPRRARPPNPSPHRLSYRICNPSRSSAPPNASGYAPSQATRAFSHGASSRHRSYPRRLAPQSIWTERRQGETGLPGHLQLSVAPSSLRPDEEGDRCTGRYYVLQGRPAGFIVQEHPYTLRIAHRLSKRNDLSYLRYAELQRLPGRGLSHPAPASCLSVPFRELDHAPLRCHGHDAHHA